jgi:predicted XRE-type DNA-binding protein
VLRLHCRYIPPSRLNEILRGMDFVHDNESALEYLSLKVSEAPRGAHVPWQAGSFSGHSSSPHNSGNRPGKQLTLLTSPKIIDNTISKEEENNLRKRLRALLIKDGIKQLTGAQKRCSILCGIPQSSISSFVNQRKCAQYRKYKEHSVA